MDTASEVVRRIRERWEETGRLERACARRAKRLDSLTLSLHVATVLFCLGAGAARPLHWPDWAAPPLALAATLAAGSVLVGRFPQKAAHYAEVCRELGRERIAWQRLWSGAEGRETAGLRAEWAAASRRLSAIAARLPFDLVAATRWRPLPAAKRAGREGVLGQ